MQKYGVEESEPKEAGEEKSNLCPSCGAVLEDSKETGVKICPNCGTKPFEGGETK